MLCISILITVVIPVNHYGYYNKLLHESITVCKTMPIPCDGFGFDIFVGGGAGLFTVTGSGGGFVTCRVSIIYKKCNQVLHYAINNH